MLYCNDFSLIEYIEDNYGSKNQFAIANKTTPMLVQYWCSVKWIDLTLKVRKKILTLLLPCFDLDDSIEGETIYARTLSYKGVDVGLVFEIDTEKIKHTSATYEHPEEFSGSYSLNIKEVDLQIGDDVYECEFTLNFIKDYYENLTFYL